MISIVVRTLNESRYLEELLGSIRAQKSPQPREVIIVDSGSTDSTLDIARRHGCRILAIDPKEFTFGRSLNRGCAAAQGEFLVFISGHCIPCDDQWLQALVAPLADGRAQFSYGRQTGRDTTRYSEQQLFEKLYPDFSYIRSDEIFCNNANAALLKSQWQKTPFDESLTGLEDMMMARAIVQGGGAVAYVAEAPVFHIHNESWRQVKLRFEREALAMQKIMPEIHFGLLDFLRCFVAGVVHDFRSALSGGAVRALAGIVAFRFMQFYGTYEGHRLHKPLSLQRKREYFYPGTTRTRRHEQDH